MDFDKIDKVLYNILSNAAKYTPADKKVELNVSTLQKDNSRFLRIEVQDEGIGIDQKEISKDIHSILCEQNSLCTSIKRCRAFINQDLDVSFMQGHQFLG